MARVWSLLLLVCALAIPAAAQEAPTDQPEEALAKAEERLKSLQNAESDDDKRWKQAVEERVALLKEFLEVAKAAAAMQDPDAARLEEQDQRAGKELESAQALVEPQRVELAKAEDLAGFEQAGKVAAAEFDDAQKALADFRTRIQTATQELKDLPARESNARKRIDSLTGKDDLSVWRIASARVELRIVADRTAYRTREIDILTRQLPVKQKLVEAARLRAAQDGKRLELARAEATALREAEAARIEREAAEKRREAARQADPIERFRTRTDADVRSLLALEQTLQSQVSELHATVEREANLLKVLQLEKAHIVERLELSGEGSAELLRQTKERNDRRGQLLKRREADYETQAAANQLALVTVHDQQFEYLQTEIEPRKELQELRAQAPARSEEIDRAIREASAKMVDALNLIANQRQLLAQDFRQLDVATGKLRDFLVEFDGFVRERLFWTRSDPPLGPDVLAKARQELPKLRTQVTDRELWRSRSVGEPFQITFAFLSTLGLMCLLFAGSLVRRWQEGAGTGAAGPTAGTVSLRLLRTAAYAAGPLILLLIAGQVLRALDLNPSLPRMFTEAALYYSLWRMSAGMMSFDQELVRYLRMSEDVARQVHRSITLTALAGALFVAPARILALPPFALDAIPRLLETAGHALFVAALVLLVTVRGALRKELTRRSRTMRNLWFVVGPLSILGFLFALAMDVVGYRFGAKYVLRNALLSAGNIFLLAMVYSILVRGVDAIASRVRKKILREEDAATAWESWEQVKGQLTRLVSVLVLGLAVFVMIKFWGLGATALGDIGSVRLTEIEMGEWLTLGDVLVALLWVVGGHYFVNNLSGIYEFLIVPLAGKGTTGGRFVILTLARYGIYLVAYGVALMTLGFEYTKLAWMATALSFGIGFGLQEIVANFVSGLILLLERPVRVGDLVTVGDKEGKVERISMRATTVTNWDQQQIIIPNKDFITKELTNWTRGSDVMRRKLFVGVAFGTDVTRLMRILDELLKAHPKVAKDPAPRIFFVGFGQSSLDFELWIYTSIEEGLATRSQLYDQIYARLTSEKISIPYPQRDVHVIQQQPERAPLDDADLREQISEVERRVGKT